jgi:Zn-dependent protease
MPIALLFSNPILGIVFLLAIALAVSVHEAAHAWTAHKLGDDTARLMGRTSINPLVHLDPIGTLLFLFAGFGWGKPVPVNEHRLRRSSDYILIALAGPASNLIIAVVLGLLYRVLAFPGIQDVLSLFISINLALMVFNLIPIPPLDGSKVLQLFLPREFFHMLEQYGFILILALFFVLSNTGLANWLTQAVSILFTLITGSSASF